MHLIALDEENDPLSQITDKQSVDGDSDIPREEVLEPGLVPVPEDPQVEGSREFPEDEGGCEIDEDIPCHFDAETEEKQHTKDELFNFDDYVMKFARRDVVTW